MATRTRTHTHTHNTSTMYNVQIYKYSKKLRVFRQSKGLSLRQQHHYIMMIGKGIRSNECIVEDKRGYYIDAALTGKKTGY